MVSINGRLPVFSDIVEMELVDHLMWLDDHFFGLTVTEVCKLAFSIAEKNNMYHICLIKMKLWLGKKWHYAFC